MSWVEPFFTCGECGGEIGRFPHVNLLRQTILDWRHRTVGAGHGPHRAVLGTPAHTPDIRDVPSKARKAMADEEPEPEPAPEPTVPARPALAGDLPPSAARFAKKAEASEWTIQAWYMRGPLMTAAWKFSCEVESVVIWADRDGHRLIASWQNRVLDGVTPAWKFESGWSRTHVLTAVSSPELNAALTVPRSICESCGEPPALHYSSDTGPVCWTERHPFL